MCRRWWKELQKAMGEIEMSASKPRQNAVPESLFCQARGKAGNWNLMAEHGTSELVRLAFN